MIKTIFACERRVINAKTCRTIRALRDERGFLKSAQCQRTKPARVPCAADRTINICL